jgi:hypothetical protein
MFEVAFLFLVTFNSIEQQGKPPSCGNFATLKVLYL